MRLGKMDKPSNRFSRGRVWGRLALAAMLCLLASGCSIRRFAINQLGNALAHSGTTFAADDDPELVRGAVPFSLKLIESLLAETPRHEGLLLAAASGFTQYSFAFVQQDAEELQATDLEASEAGRTRARRLYLRARNYALRGLEVRHPGFGQTLRADPRSAVQALGQNDVELMYWTAAAWGSLISLSKNDPEVIADQPVVEALIDRALELDEDYGDGALHAFLISYESSRQSGTGTAEARARRHFERAMQLSGGKQAGPLVSLAEAVCIQKQDAREFKALLERALALNPDAAPEARLVNLVMQRRARWLLSRLDDLFLLEPANTETTK
jgi:predicted anti-sigma-YlaC factor YlaD